jgi:hypothetical protein
MNSLIYYLDSSIIRPGKLSELKNAVKQLVEFVDLKEARLISYNIYFNEEDSQMSLLQIHPDSASLEFHLELGGPIFLKFKDLIQLLTIQIYGEPSENLLEQLHRKAQMLGNAKVTIHNLQAGFSRF